MTLVRKPKPSCWRNECCEHTWTTGQNRIRYPLLSREFPEKVWQIKESYLTQPPNQETHRIEGVVAKSDDLTFGKKRAK